MDNLLEVVDIHKAEGGKGMDKEDSPVSSLMVVYESAMKMKPSLISKIWRIAFALSLML